LLGYFSVKRNIVIHVYVSVNNGG